MEKVKQDLIDQFAYKGSRKAILKKIKQQLRKRKLLIKDERVIEYTGSPTGKAFLGVAKKPFMKVKNGFGYMGVLIQTENRVFIQCHICGKWVRSLGQYHLKKHDITALDYKLKFGLYPSNGLVSDERSQQLADSGRANVLRFNLNKDLSNEVRRRGTATQIANRKKNELKLGGMVEWQNRFAICEQQIGFRLIEWIKKYRDLPSRSNKKGDGRSICKVLARRFGSLNDGFAHYGLPTRYRKGTSVELNAPNGKQLFFNYNKKSYHPDEVYAWLITQCPMLDPAAINMFADDKTKKAEFVAA